ncbi:MAG: hypothetical protein KZQ70_14245 [gamma proteobacterium symbiont of Lucinoma myriamae]|nr:hypothetical protein [gamma proteobacterium symbiont of Lucinoma myriamae]
MIIYRKKNEKVKTVQILLFTLAGIMMTIALSVLAGNKNSMTKTLSETTINNAGEGQFNL